jgi:hypothetical protein
MRDAGARSSFRQDGDMAKVARAGSDPLHLLVVALVVASAFLVTIFMPILAIWIGVVVTLTGVIRGLRAKAAERSHTSGRVAVYGAIWSLGPLAYLALALFQ